MLFDDAEFSHIVVHDDEILIQAGCRKANTTCQPSAKDAHSTADAHADVEAHSTADVYSTADTHSTVEKHTDVNAQLTIDECAAKDAHPRAEAHSTADAYTHKVSEDDLRAKPMPVMQKIIIVLAFLILLASVVYYLCFM